MSYIEKGTSLYVLEYHISLNEGRDETNGSSIREIIIHLLTNLLKYTFHTA